MIDELSIGKWVVCRGGSGHMMKGEAHEKISTHFSKNSIGRLRKLEGAYGFVYLVEKASRYRIPITEIDVINVFKTGKGFDDKICNLCFVLKPMIAFDPNQTDAKGKTTHRPSCKECRQKMNLRAMSPVEKNRADKEKPKKGTLWRCPICRKRSIVGVTANIVLDHQHSTGAARFFLCDSCNTGLGRFKNGEDYLKNALAYVKEANRKR